jgi:aminoglycoside 3-N-acetyltransferase
MLLAKLENKIRDLGLKSGDKVLVSSDLLNFFIQIKKTNNQITINNIIDILLKIIGKNGTILFPTFNWDALKRKEFKRSRNPIYSFAVAGKDRDYICRLKHKACFGLDSPLGYLIEKKAKNLSIGLDYKDGFTFVHVVEELVGVDYRYNKKYSGITIINKKKKLEIYSMYVRDLSLNLVTVINKKLDKILLRKKLLLKNNFYKIKMTMIDINKTFKILSNDLKNKGILIQTKKLKP